MAEVPATGGRLPAAGSFSARAPVRIDLAGGWTDVPPFAEREGGAVVSVAIDRYAYATLRPRAAPGVRLESLDYGETVEADGVAGLEYDGTLDLVKAAVRRHPPTAPCELTTRCEAPGGSGLGTSAAVAVATLGVLQAAGGAEPDPAGVAAAASALETEELGIAGGRQDPLAAALGGARYMEFGEGAPTAETIAAEPGVWLELERRMVLVFSGASRLSGEVVGQVQAAYRAGTPATVAALREMRALATELRDRLEGGDVDALGGILARNWRCQKALHPAVTTGRLDALFEVAARSGALGGKACGAGGGGSLVFLAAEGAEHRLRTALTDAGAIPIDAHLAWTGLRCWSRPG